MCRICFKRPGNVAYHLIPKQRGHGVRWLVENGVLACSQCNFGEMINRASYRDKHIFLFGKDRVEGIEKVASESVGMKVDRFSVFSALSLELKKIGIEFVAGMAPER